jgi:hypothetical protein
MHGVEGRIEPFVDGVVGRGQRHRHEQAGAMSRSASFATSIGPVCDMIIAKAMPGMIKTCLIQ